MRSTLALSEQQAAVAKGLEAVLSSVDAAAFTRGLDADGRSALRLTCTLPNGALLDITEATLAALVTVAAAEVAAAQ